MTGAHSKYAVSAAFLMSDKVLMATGALSVLITFGTIDRFVRRWMN